MEAANTLFGKAVDVLFGVVKQEIDYVRNCSENVAKLRNEAQKLNDMKGMVQQRIDVAKEKGDRLSDGVQNWIAKADAEISMAGEFLQEEADAKKTCFNSRLCVNLGILRRYSKMATCKTRGLLQIHEDGKTYESCVSVPARTPSIVDLYERKNLDDLDTHKLTLGEIIKALSDESIQIVGIYGFGGVGKTTLAKEVVAEAKNLFEEIVFITVSQTVDANKIRDEVKVAAKRIINGDKVLIVLDDIWEELLFSDVGIPCGNDHMNCKILLTSRSKNVCDAMNVQRNICVNTLTEEESRVLFKRVVGERVERDTSLKRIATKIIQECGGLPLIIQVVGRALRSKPTHIWEATLDRLQNHAPLDIAPEIRKAFTHLKLSYDYLESEEAKSLFLLCSLFREDGYIPLEDLVNYGVGLGVFNDLNSIRDARNRVQIAVDTLKSSFLLLPIESTDTAVKMHDVVRDVALLIASKGKDNFLVKSGKTEWKPRNDTSESYTKMSFMYNKVRELPDHELHFPLLDTFIIRGNGLSVVPDMFFGGMREVKVLDLSCNYISFVPQSLKLLTKLRMLDLSSNQGLKEISILGELKELEILMLGCTGIETIPEEIGQLTSLRLLNLEWCQVLSHITPGVISRLTCLEELHILNCLGDATQLSLVELSNLKSFKYLRFFAYDPGFFSQGSAHLETLTRFYIQIGDRSDYILSLQKSHIQRILYIGRTEITYVRPAVKKLIQVSESIVLLSLEDIDSILPDLYEESFNDLKCLTLEDCHNVSCLVKTTSDEDAIILDERKTKEKFFAQMEELVLRDLDRLDLLWDCPHQYVSFGSLQTIKIEKCNSLLTLFPVSVAQGLVNLSDIEIQDCESLVVVISADDEDTSSGEIEQREGIEVDGDIVFPCLTNISLSGLSGLESFYSGNSSIKYPSLKFIKVQGCVSMTRWADGVHDMPNIKFHHQGMQCSINDIIAYEASGEMEFKSLNDD